MDGLHLFDIFPDGRPLDPPAGNAETTGSGNDAVGVTSYDLDAQLFWRFDLQDDRGASWIKILPERSD